MATAGDRRTASGARRPESTFITEYCASNAENFEHEGEHMALVKAGDMMDRESA